MVYNTFMGFIFSRQGLAPTAQSRCQNVVSTMPARDFEIYSKRKLFAFKLKANLKYAHAYFQIKQMYHFIYSGAR